MLYPDAFAAELRKTTCRLVPETCFDWPDGADEIYLNAFAWRPLSVVSGAYDVAYNFEQSVDTHFRGDACVAAQAGRALAVDRRRRSPCAGQRIGEASNPGPGALAAKRRKQEGPITKGQVRNICKQLLREFVNELGWHGSFPQARPTAEPEPQHDEFQDWQAGDSDRSGWPGHSHRRGGSGWWDATSSGRGAQPRHESHHWSYDAGHAWHTEWDTWCDGPSHGEDGAAGWQDRWHGAFSSWDDEAIAGAKAGHAVSYYGASTATPGASWSTSWDDWGGSAPRRRWADLHDEEEGDANDDSGKDPAPARNVSLRPVHDRTVVAPAAGAKSRWRKRKSRKAEGDVDEHHAESWTLRRDLWNTSGPFAYVSSVVELSELLDTAQGVSILAQASSEDDAAEMWDIIKSAAQDPDAFDTALTLLCPVSDQSKPWCPDDDTDTSLVPVPGTQAGKLVHVKHWACSIGSAPPSLGTRKEAIHKVRRPPAPLQVQRAQSILVRMTTDRAYNTASWQDICKEPSRFARVWANQLGVKQSDIIDAFGFGLQGSTRVVGLLRLRSESVAHVLWKAAGSSFGGATFFADLVGEHQALATKWTKEEVVIQWIPWTASETFTDYLRRTRSGAALGIVVGRGLGRRMKATDPNFVQAPIMWRAKAVPAHYVYADVASLLEDLGFDSVTIHGRHRGRKTCDWTFKATRPDRAPMLQQHVDWGNDFESELVIVKESARRGNPAVQATFRPIAPGRSITFGEVAEITPKRGPCSRRARKGREDVVMSPQPPDAGNPPEAASRGAKRAVPGEEPGRSMTVDAEGPAGEGNNWAPLAKVLTNVGEGNCLYHALAQLDIGGKPRTHRQLRRFAHMCLQSHAETLKPLWTDAGSHNTLGRPACLSWDDFLAEMSSNASWGGCLELMAICLSLGYRAWVFTSTGTLHCINGDGEAGFMALRYDVAREHWEAFDNIDETHLKEHHVAMGSTVFDYANNLCRGGGALSDCASSVSNPGDGAHRRPSLSECASDYALDGPQTWHAERHTLHRQVCDALFEPASTQDSASLVQALQAAGSYLSLDSRCWCAVLDFVCDEVGVLVGDSEICPWTERQLQYIHEAFDYLRYACGNSCLPDSLTHSLPDCSTAGPELSSPSAPRKPFLSLTDCASSSALGYSRRCGPSSAATRSVRLASPARLQGGLLRDARTWFCEECREHIRPAGKMSLSRAKRTHILRVHPGADPSSFGRIRGGATCEATKGIQDRFSAWSCFWCRRGLPMLLSTSISPRAGRLPREPALGTTFALMPGQWEFMILGKLDACRPSPACRWRDVCTTVARPTLFARK